ncbi:MAG: serine/threonine-protein kinase [Deltaproteobacteria bacterium]|nr:serine/threonine-protein kinase [Deltaproteobacteria bacterium]
MKLDATRWARVKELFAQTVALPADEARQILGSVDDDDVAAEVRSLLGFHVDDDLVAARSPPPLERDPADPLGLCGQTLRTQNDDDVAITRFVAAGGFGVVYRGAMTGSRAVAVKVLRPLVSPLHADELAQALLREAALLRELCVQAPAIVRCEDVGVVDVDAGGMRKRVPFLVLEWLEGVSLGQLLRSSRQPWPLARVLELAAPVAAALVVAHERGVAHRDIKPDNLFVEEGAHGARLRLLDFGVAKVAGDSDNGFLSTAGQLGVATARYAAPEQLRRDGGPTGPWTDVWAFALVLVELLSGERATGDADLASLLLRVRPDARPPTPRSCGVDVSDVVEAAFAAALATTPAHRPSMATFFQTLSARP